MTYDPLLLNCGGGIISDNDKSAQYTGSAALCIGVGGTGVAALSELRGKIYQQLRPDNPGEPVPRYNGIQLLGIDADDTDYKTYRGHRRLSDSEFCSIKVDNLSALIGTNDGKDQIRKDPGMNWMEIDKITKLLSANGAGGVRQMGRYMLMKHITEVSNMIAEKAEAALRERDSSELDVYIFAGISGGTGSGCFLDVCYLVRAVIAAKGLNANLMGYFFLPDVVTSKEAVRKEPGAVAYNNSNGYAAMKELDYLMDLPSANDYFRQNYGTKYEINTQSPPVDMCHLISAQQADNKLVPNGFGYGINVAADYAMSYLAEVDTTGTENDETGLTMRGHLANVAKGVQNIPRRYGANLSYHILGASNAEIPMSQINTYLAAGFFRKFREAAYKDRKVVTKDIAQRFMEDNRFDVRNVYRDLTQGTPTLELADIDRKLLASRPCFEKDKCPEAWGEAADAWRSEAQGARSRNALALNRELDGFDYTKINDQSLIGRLFRKVYDMCLDPNYGPYYAAALLDNNGQDLQAALTGEIAKAVERAESFRRNMDNKLQYKFECNQDLCDKRGSKRTYLDFKQSCHEAILWEEKIYERVQTAEVLRNFLAQVKALSDTFFRPLCTMLDNLDETFRANEAYLKTPEAKQANAYTWQILSLADVKDRLDNTIKELDETGLVNRFMGHLLVNSDYWLSNKADQIALVVKEYMLKLFSDETNRSLEDYLYDLYKKDVPAGNVALLTEKIKEKILRKVDNDAVPMFWCDPTYDIRSKDVTFSCNRLSVPSASAVVCSAAEGYTGGNSTGYTVRKTGISDRIFALRFVSGIPLFAYHGITKLKADYDNAATSAAGAGSHLYAKTGRGKDESGQKDWRRFLPTPMPYSKVKDLDNNMVPEGKRLVELYNTAVERGIIGVKPGTGTAVQEGEDVNEDYAIFVTGPQKLEDYTLSSFMINGKFSKDAYDRVHSDLVSRAQNLHAFGKNPSCTAIDLKNDGHPKLANSREEVRMDYFIHYPLLHEAVRGELEKDAALKTAIDQVETILREHEAYESDLATFANLLFYRMLRCTNDSGALDCDKTQFVECDMLNQYDEIKTFYLCDKQMPYSTYPLYQAFRSFRYLKDASGENTENLDLTTNSRSALKNLRKSLDEQQSAYHNRRRVEGDYLVPAILEMVWTADALEELEFDTLSNERKEIRDEIVGFYKKLRSIVGGLKQKSTIWPRNKTLGELQKMLSGNSEADAEPAPVQPAPVAPVAPAAPISTWIWANNEQLELHTGLSTTHALDRKNNAWVLLTNQMFVLLNNQWVPVRLDPNNNIIL